MKARPILFSAPMVRAVLDDSKTQTRRVAIKTSQPDSVVLSDYDASEFKIEIENTHSGTRTWKQCRYGVPGDRLWVRETWRSVPMICLNDGHPSNHIEYAAGRRVLPQGKPPAVWEVPEHTCQKWKPSIHMFRKDSRITLEITSVRVERLQDISEADAKAEGLTCQNGLYATPGQVWQIDPRKAYRDLWESINGPGSWDVNPWVWVIEFKRLPS